LKLRSGHWWRLFVRATLPDGTVERIEGFATKADAVNLILEDMGQVEK
jgi:hypothetical protein